MDDPVLLNDWHAVAAGDALARSVLVPARLLDREIVLWRSRDGVVHAWADRCVHRGTRLSIGRIEGDEVVCGYHGWRYGAAGRCTHIPSQPTQKLPDNACVE